MAAKFFTGLPMDGPDPECVQGYGTRRWRRSAKSPGPQAITRTGGGAADPYR